LRAANLVADSSEKKTAPASQVGETVQGAARTR